MLWIKALHIVFVVTWFAGLFYLPRLLIYHTQTTETAVAAQLKIMQRRLLMITRIGGALAVTFGLATLLWYASHSADYFKQGWLHAKLTLVLGLVGYQVYLARLVKLAAQDHFPHSARWLRWFNEVPALFLIAIVILVVVKP